MRGPCAHEQLRAFVDALKSPDIAARLRDLGLDPIANSPEAFSTYLRSEIPKCVSWNRMRCTVAWPAGRQTGKALDRLAANQGHFFTQVTYLRRGPSAPRRN